MPIQISRLVNLALFGLVFVACAGTALVSARYLVGGPFRSPAVLANAFVNPFLLIHVAGGVTALTLAPLQFIARLRRSNAHRWIGRTYVGGCLIGGAAGLIVAAGTTAGPVASSGFSGLALAWIFTTGMGWRTALQRDFSTHRRWMIRSFSLTLAAVTLRVYLPLLPILGIEFFEGYRAISWLCWVPNLLVAELYLRRATRLGHRAIPAV